MMYPWLLVHHYLNQECHSKSLRPQCNKDMILHPPLSMPYPQHLPLPSRPSKPAQRFSTISMISTFGTILMHTAYLEANFKADKRMITLRAASRTLNTMATKLVP